MHRKMNLKSENINYKIAFIGKIIFVILLFTMLITSISLYFEYSFFKKQSNNMIELQEDYRTYIGAVNKILVDYNRVKEELENQSESIVKVSQKKKDKSLSDNLDKNKLSDIYFYNNFPENSKIVSSKDYSVESFCVVNRDIKHLRNSSLIFIKKYYKSKGSSGVVSLPNFFDYTEYSLAKITEANKMLEQAKKARLKAERQRKFDLLSKKIRKSKRSGYTRKTKKFSSYPGENSDSIFKDNDKKIAEINLSWPVDKARFYFSSLFGPRRKPSGAWGFHRGVDMCAMKGTPVYAAHSGIVVEALHRSDYGNTIVIAHSRKYRTRYAHLSKMFVSVGHKVSRSEPIGAVGNTGRVRSSSGDGSHLHFEVIEFGKKVNPLPFIS